MKKIILNVLLLSLLSIVLSNCKKEEDEGPLISFRSKDNRLEGEWNLIKFKGKEAYGIGNGTYAEALRINLSYDGTIYTIAPIGYLPENRSLDFTMAIEKSGILVIDQSFTNPIEAWESISSWNWVNDTEKKSKLILNDFPLGIEPTGSIYTVQKLTNKELILTVKQSILSQTNTGFADIEMDYTFTFEKLAPKEDD